MTRRELLRYGIVGVAGLTAVGLVYEWWPDRPGTDAAFRYRVLDDEERLIVAAIAPVMLAGALPADSEQHDAAVLAVVRGMDTAVAGLSPSTQAEIAQLFGLLRFPLTRMFAAGIWHPWHSADSAEIDRFLHVWRFSGIAKLRSAYDALHQLLLASWYGNPQSWTRLGYPGPPKVRVNP